LRIGVIKICDWNKKQGTKNVGNGILKFWVQLFVHDFNLGRRRNASFFSICKIVNSF